MTTLRTAAQQALGFVTSEAWGTTPYMDVRVYEDAARLRDVLQAALRAALAQQDEPVAWLQPKTVGGYSRPDLGYETCSKDDYGAFPVYHAPPQRKPLTEEEIDNICRQAHGGADPQEWARNFARAVEQAAWEKNNG